MGGWGGGGEKATSSARGLSIPDAGARDAPKLLKLHIDISSRRTQVFVLFEEKFVEFVTNIVIIRIRYITIKNQKTKHFETDAVILGGYSLRPSISNSHFHESTLNTI